MILRLLFQKKRSGKQLDRCLLTKPLVPMGSPANSIKFAGRLDIMSAISAIWSRKFANFELLNSAYVTLLPKKEDATSVKDFRPISLVHSFAKLVTKILANRLASYLNQLVSPNQSAFIKG